MSSLRKDSHSMHNPTRSNGAEHSNRSSRRRLASHPGRWSTTGYEFSEPPVTVGVRSRISSDSTPSCASLPRQTHDHSRHFAVRTVSSYAGIPNDCSPIALSVITSVLGLNKEIRRLTKCICHQNEVVEDFQNALTMLANIQNREHERDWGYETFKLAFLPTRSMDLAGVELTVAAYIFSKDLPNSEILAYVEHCIADRTALLTLAPNERVMDDVITVVATMLSKTSNSYQWFMPTMIMQDALQGTHLTHANLDAVICNHMRCKVNKVTEIFQPMWTDGYWYLMVVDVRRKKLIYYDSLKCTRETEHRKFAMTQVVSIADGCMYLPDVSITRWHCIWSR